MENSEFPHTYAEITKMVEFKKNIGYIGSKQVIDIFGALFGMIFLSPVMLITMIAIKIDSKGAVIFSQQRVGENGKLFKMYKFRSMVTGAEELQDGLKGENEMSGPMFKIKEDPRITKVGRFIRKTSIDELPQLINVLKRDMSLVGPRPNLPIEVDKFSPYQKQKLFARPGLTCYWQVMGRNQIGFEQWMDLDIKYLTERTLWIDIKLIFKTIVILFWYKNGS